MESKELTIVIVTFKSDEKIINCLKSISNNIPVIVVENSNNQNFKNKVENIFTNVKCILAGENKGYPTANNIGLKTVKTKYALVLNPDTILDKHAIKNFFKTKEQVKDFWLIGPANNQHVNFNENDSNLKEVDNLKGKNGESYNVGTGMNFTNIELVKKILKICKNLNIKIGKKTKIKFVEDRPGHDFRYALNNKKIFKDLKWKSKMNFDKGLKNTIIWYLDNLKFLKDISKKNYEKRLGLKT